MSWDKYCQETASAPDGNSWLMLLAGALVVVGVLVLIVVL